MRSIFIRFYIGMLLASITVGLITYGLVAVINQYRLESYVRDVTRGTFVLLAEAIGRHPADKREQWLSLVNNLSGLRLNQHEADTLALSRRVRELLQQQHVYITKPLLADEAIIYLQIPGDEKNILSTRLADINEQIVRSMALLVLGEMQRLQIGEENADFARLQSLFHFPVSIQPRSAFQLTYAQQRLLQRNEMLVQLSQTANGDAALTIYAPFDHHAENLLVMGPVLRYQSLPGQLVLLLGILSLLLMAFSAYVLVNPLARRLQRMAAEVENIGVESGTASITVAGNDMLGAFAAKVNAMAGRIQKLLQTQKELTRAVSHELRTPIARMKFHLALLDGQQDQAQLHKHLQGMQKDLHQLEALVDELLTYADLEQSQPALHFSQFDLTRQVQQQLQELALVKPDVCMQLQSSETVMVVADSHFLQRACQNLLINAQRHARQKVDVLISCESGHCCLCVDDDGEGVPEAMREAIFEPFSRVDQSRNRHSGGYGLGLAIVYQIMRWHQGRVEVSESPLGGARFCLIWPQTGKKNDN